MTQSSLLDHILSQHLSLAQKAQNLLPSIQKLGQELLQTLQSGHKLLIFGNGGSAGDAQHIAAELSGRFEKERKALPAIALTTDSSALTAIGNDYGFDSVFSRQLEALATKDDLILGISTSGNSPNILKALELAQKKSCLVWGFSGKDGGAMNTLLREKNICVDSESTARIQEMHILFGHMICAWVEQHI